MAKTVGARSGSGYWSVQIVSTGVLGIGFVVYSVVLLVVVRDEPGGAVLMALIGILFLTTLGWAVDAVTRSTAEERALFAWAITQHEAENAPFSRPNAMDFLAVRDAGRARDGELDLAEIRRLQALRPDNPYPADLPALGAPDTLAATKRPAARNRLPVALIALFLALTGLYFSCIPPVFVLGWPFQLIASILAVIAIVPRGRGRRLGIAAASVSVLGTLVTIVMLVSRVIAELG